MRDVMAEVDALDLPDGEYGDVFDYIVDDPEFFGVEKE